MKKLVILLLIFGCSLNPATAQKVDSIKVEQSGDFVKIRYKILNSNPDQLFRVKVVYSVNGGLNIEPRSLSGDAGDNIVGGKSEYFVIWDVLKDVEELGSAEFIVRAELIKNLGQSVVLGKPRDELTKYWSKERIHIVLSFEYPGPKAGITIGYMGSVGLVAQFLTGKAVFEKDYVSIFGPVNEIGFGSGLCLTKRVINKGSFQMHLMAGITSGFLIYESPLEQAIKFTKGGELGVTFGIKRFVACMTIRHLDPGSVEKGTDYYSVSPLNYFSTGVGIRF